MAPRPRLFVALDTPDAGRARDLAAALSGRVGFKVGLELFVAHGAPLVRELAEQGPVFLDLKLHDIPNTVAGAAAAIGRLGVDLFTLHAAGGEEMMRRGASAAAEQAEREGFAPPIALAVTVLTSLDRATLDTLGMGEPLRAVERLATLARAANVGGVVCSSGEIGLVRGLFPRGVVVVPGIRTAAQPVGGDDQARTASPAQAWIAGADVIVVGRPITRAGDPLAAAEAILAELESVR